MTAEKARLLGSFLHRSLPSRQRRFRRGAAFFLPAAVLDGAPPAPPGLMADRRRDRRAKAGAGVPALARFEAAVVPLHRVAEGALVPRRIERRIDEARRLAILPVGDGNQPGP